ncbi:MAG: hypothetical protein C0596_15555 [Marinilabiliales bacterium]|nr:MAG: hypothetical protein C0596_15555 [Marinilabiliales bacterium]
MKNFKRITTVLVVLFSITAGITFNSCNKYEEGPSFSLLSATKRITGTWELTETLLNDEVVDVNDMLDMFGEMPMDTSMSEFEFDISEITVNSVMLTFEKSGAGNLAVSISYMMFPFTQNESMTWTFDDDKENVSITVMGDVQTFEIIRLTNKELWLRRVETTGGVTNTTIMKAEKEED